MIQELIVNGYSLDLSTDTNIALNVLSGDITQLNRRVGDFTNSFTIPASNHNMTSLGYVNLITSDSDLPYKVVRATYKVDGVEVASDAFCVISSVTPTSITMNIFSGQTDFIKLLEDVTVGELYGDEGLDWTIQNVIDGSDEFIFPMINWEEGSSFFDVNTTVNPKKLLPCLKWSSLLDKISDYTGYSIVDNLGVNLCVTPDDLNVDVEELGVNNTYFNGTAVTAIAQGSSTQQLSKFCEWSFNPPDDFDTINGFVPTVNYLGRLSFKGSIAFGWKRTSNLPLFSQPRVRTVTFVAQIKDDLGNVLRSLQVAQYNGTLDKVDGYDIVVETPLYTFTAGRSYNIEVTATVEQHDNVTSEFDFGFTPSGSTSTLSLSTNGTAVYGNELKPSNIYNMKVVDVLKTVMNSYQLMLSTDGYIQQLTINKLDSLIENTNNAIDWSNNLLSIENIAFSLPNMAKRNNLKYKEEDTLPNDSDSLFTIANENLPDGNDYVQLPIPMTRMYDGFNNEGIPLINGLDSDISWLSPPWRVLEYEERNTAYNITYNDGTDSSIETKAPFAMFRKFDYLRDNYFKVIQEVNIDAKVVDAIVRLNAVELQEIRNNFTPVWISNANLNIDGYYYVNKLDSYMNNKAKVQLIRL